LQRDFKFLDRASKTVVHEAQSIPISSLSLRLGECKTTDTETLANHLGAMLHMSDNLRQNELTATIHHLEISIFEPHSMVHLGQTKVLIDTGCSMTSISQNFYNQLNSKNLLELYKSQVDVTTTTCDGSENNIAGITTILVAFNTKEITSSFGVPINVLVIPNLANNMILGLDFLSSKYVSKMTSDKIHYKIGNFQTSESFNKETYNVTKSSTQISSLRSKSIKHDALLSDKKASRSSTVHSDEYLDAKESLLAESSLNDSGYFQPSLTSYIESRSAVTEFELEKLPSTQMSDLDLLQLFELSHLPPLALKQVEQIILKCRPAFSLHKYDIGKTNVLEMDIDLINNDSPKIQKYLPIPLHARDKVKDILDQMEKHGIIRVCHEPSPYVSNIMVIPKKDKDSIRLLFDGRLLNYDTKRLPMSFVTKPEILAHLIDRTHLSSLDFSDAFFHIPLTKEAQPLTAFYAETNNKRMCFTRAPQGLKNSPLYLKILLDKIFQDLSDNLLFYVDDLLIATKGTLEEHFNLVETILRRLIKAGLKLRPQKLLLARSQIQFLGMIFERNRLSIPEARTKAFRELPSPKTAKQLKSAICAFSYYRHFIPNFSEFSRELMELANTSPKLFKFTDQHEIKFRTLIKHINDNTCTYFPEPNKPFYIQTDASLFCAGGRLYQKDDQNNERLIAAVSRTFSKTERHYTIYKKEALALLYTLRSMEFFIRYAPKLVILVDAKSLIYIRLAKESTGILLRFSLELSKYDADIIHVPGIQNEISDLLSRSHKDISDIEADIANNQTINERDTIRIIDALTLPTNFTLTSTDLFHLLNGPSPKNESSSKPKSKSKAKEGIRQVKNTPQILNNRKVRMPRLTNRKRPGVILPVSAQIGCLSQVRSMEMSPSANVSSNQGSFVTVESPINLTPPVHEPPCVLKGSILSRKSILREQPQFNIDSDAHKSKHLNRHKKKVRFLLLPNERHKSMTTPSPCKSQYPATDKHSCPTYLTDFKPFHDVCSVDGYFSSSQSLSSDPNFLSSPKCSELGILSTTTQCNPSCGEDHTLGMLHPNPHTTLCPAGSYQTSTPCKPSSRSCILLEDIKPLHSRGKGIFSDVNPCKQPPRSLIPTRNPLELLDGRGKVASHTLKHDVPSRSGTTPPVGIRYTGPVGHVPTPIKTNSVTTEGSNSNFDLDKCDQDKEQNSKSDIGRDARKTPSDDHSFGNYLPHNYETLRLDNLLDINGFIPKSHFLALQTQDSFVQELLTKKDGKLNVLDTLYYYSVHPGNNKPILPKSLARVLINSHHYTHPGLHKSRAQISRDINNIYFIKPQTLTDLINLDTGSCHVCQLFDTASHSENIGSLPRSDKPRQSWSIDLITDLPKSDNDYKLILLAVDDFSNFTIAIPLRDATSKEIIRAIQNHIFHPFGLPKWIRSDEQPGIYNSNEFYEFLKSHNVQLQATAVASPFSNGRAERHIRTFKQYAKKYFHQNKCISKWDEHISNIITAINTSINSFKHSPEEIMFGTKLPNTLHLLDFNENLDSIDQLIDRANTIRTNYHNQKLIKEKSNTTFKNKSASNKPFLIGDLVLHRQLQVSTGTSSKWKPVFTGPFIIESTNNDKTLNCKHIISGKIIKAHKTNLTAYKIDRTTNRLNNEQLSNPIFK